MSTDAKVVDFNDSLLISWKGLTQGDEGTGAAQVRTGARVVQAFGDFGLGGAVIVEGSLDRVHWFQLRDSANFSLSLNSNDGKAILESPPFIRPRIIGGDDTTNITVLVSVRKT